MSGAPSDLLRIARVLKSYGTDGELLAGFRETGIGDLNLKEPVFIMFDGLPVPFFIESAREKGTSKALLHLTGVRDLDDAAELVGRDIYARRDSLEGVSDDEDLSLEDLLGWSLKDKGGQFIGEIIDFEPIPGNPCLYVTHGDKTVMIPLHEDLITELDEDSRSLSIDLPDGLL